MNAAQGQTFSEWWRQKKTQKKYLIQQIVALQMYIGYARKGYSIAKDGLNFIGDLKNGEVNFHSDYFQSLEKVNPNIKQYAQVTEIMVLQYQMTREYSQSLKQLNQSKAFNEKELEYLCGVFERTLDFSLDTLNELIEICTNGDLEMTDDARLERIDLLYNQMLEHYGFYQEFSKESKQLALARLQEKGDTQKIRLMYNLK
ncbi:hypothetical protein IBL28_05245 [Sinomicrobium sp. FJxs]|uniref:TerB family tellurite resistance protein n=1 Tax=Sinomicrobium weinanense TaxID=2842200 RepID=A0A926JQB2_9FLAO|nr:hypothetical protein [Sinomicrobium weinanense]MBU3122926.1 hypothetical protein [Sinomicrobium weinanense]